MMTGIWSRRYSDSAVQHKQAVGVWMGFCILTVAEVLSQYLLLGPVMVDETAFLHDLRRRSKNLHTTKKMPLSSCAVKRKEVGSILYCDKRG